DDLGNFEITIHDSCYLLIRRIGFGIRRIKVNSITENPLNISLEPEEYRLQDIEISGIRETPIGTSLISSKQVKQLTGISKDIMRVIQLVPGVNNNNEANARFNVRGGTFDENLVTINGCRTYSPFHLKIISSSASISVFNLNMVKQINFIAGGYSANYGDALSAVMDIKYRNGNSKKISGVVDLSLMDGSFLMEGPIKEKFTYLLGFKKSNIAYFAELINNPDLKDFYFYDLQGNFNYKINKKNALDFTYIFAFDKLNPTNVYENYSYDAWMRLWGVMEQTKKEKINKGNGNGKNISNLTSINWNRDDNRLKLNNSISYYHESEDLNTKEEGAMYSKILNHPEWIYTTQTNDSDSSVYQIDMYSWKSDANFPILENLMLNAGFLVEQESFNQYQAYSEQRTVSENITYFPDTSIISIPYSELKNDTLTYSLEEYKVSAYIRINLMPLKNIFIDAGARIDYYTFNQNLDISPRIAFRYNLPFGLVFKGATGLFTQTPFLPSLNYYNIDTIRPNNQKGLHYILGLEKKMGKQTLIRLEAYYKDYLQILPATLGSTGRLYYNGTKPTDGYAKGVDLSIATNFESFSFSLNYSLMEAKESYINQDSLKVYCSRYSDQTHTFSGLFSIQLGKTWEFVAKYFYGSGYAYTPKYPQFNEDYGMELWVSGDKNSAHYPAYSRLDVSLYKTFRIKNKYDLKVYLEIINALNKQNVQSYKYTYNSDAEPVKEVDYLFPMIPSLGLSFKF
ncbi:MAG: TonB-dependent receptor plug domain-containing protein, partial [Bacteroidales bacterium]|nr:TonB-dependent receptor plug domain-containing protein [Bacteroidales bacterium]